MTRRLITSGNPLEAQAGYSRAVVQGDWCFIAGTTGRDPATGDIPDDVREQTLNAFTIIETALADAGFALTDVVRAIYYLTNIHDQHLVMPILGQKFGAVRPAATMLAVAALVQPEMKMEIEVTAFRG